MHRLELKLSIQHDKLCKENKLLQSSFPAWNVSHTLGFHLDSESRYNLVQHSNQNNAKEAVSSFHRIVRCHSKIQNHTAQLEITSGNIRDTFLVN